MSENLTTSDYWNRYYSAAPKRRIPSQFAAFVLNECKDIPFFLDCGCGNGRDAFFFAEHGKKVLGVDGSVSAIETCKDAQVENTGLDLEFQRLNFSSKIDIGNFSKKIQSQHNFCAIYARFFLHAIDETAENNFLKMCDELIGEMGVVCLEYRTDKDRLLEKETESHFRRFVGSPYLIELAPKYNLDTLYFAEGFGFAKHGVDDAHVARLILGRKK